MTTQDAGHEHVWALLSAWYGPDPKEVYQCACGALAECIPGESIAASNIFRKRGAWKQTVTGIAFEPLNPTPNMFALKDIAVALSQNNRFSGMTKYPYSVAQHSCYVADWVMRETGDPLLAFAGLWHDAMEAQIGDMIKPIKVLNPGFTAIEERGLAVAAEKYGFPFPLPEVVHRADLVVLANESAALFDGHPRPWNLPYPPDEALEITPWSPLFARTMWFTRHTALWERLGREVTDEMRAGVEP